MAADDSEERTIHRLEAFSDIVIGFSLAQLGATLAIPERGANLFAHPIWIAAFLWSFSMICTMWLQHHRLFGNWFVPRALTITLNFAWLATVVLLAYDTQLAVRDAGSVVTWQAYFLLYALAYGLLAVQYALGIRFSADRSGEERVGGWFGVAHMSVWGTTFALCALYMFTLQGSLPAFLVMTTCVAAGLSSSLLSRYRRRVRARA